MVVILWSVLSCLLTAEVKLKLWTVIDRQVISFAFGLADVVTFRGTTPQGKDKKKRVLGGLISPWLNFTKSA